MIKPFKDFINNNINNKMQNIGMMDPPIDPLLNDQIKIEANVHKKINKQLHMCIAYENWSEFLADKKTQHELFEEIQHNQYGQTTLNLSNDQVMDCLLGYALLKYTRLHNEDFKFEFKHRKCPCEKDYETWS